MDGNLWDKMKYEYRTAKLHMTLNSLQRKAKKVELQAHSLAEATLSAIKELGSELELNHSKSGVKKAKPRKGVLDDIE